MNGLAISGLRVEVDGTAILTGIDLEVPAGEVHAVMGPNGSGKSTLSHVLMGRRGYDVVGGTVTLDGRDLLALPTHERAHAGLFLALQYPVEVPGVSLLDALTASLSAAGRPSDTVGGDLAREAERIGFDPQFLERPLNVDLSGGEKKRNETLQMAVLKPTIAVLDEIDSGLDVDAMRAVSRRVRDAVDEDGLGVLAITHYSRLLEELRPDVVHVIVGGRIIRSGGPEIAAELEATGYATYRQHDPATAASTNGGGTITGDDPFADPFADPLA
ncbi:MAG TPA: Fe-S cluster assembly ATPase SufC [Acidimicrobiales bacterium]